MNRDILQVLCLTAGLAEKEVNFMYNTRLNNDSNNPIMHASVTFTDFGSGIIQ